MKKQKIIKITKRVFIGIFGLVIILSIIGWIYEVNARSKAIKEFPPPGRMVSVGSHKLHIDARGVKKEGYPTIVLEAGMDPWGSMSWSLVHDSLAKTNRVIAYDRAGMAWSETGPRPRVGEKLADELHELLINSGEKGPFIVVAQSMGGPYARIFAKKYFDEMAGLILVESSHPDQFNRMSNTEGFRPPPTLLIKLGPMLRKIGVMRNIMKEELEFPSLPEDKQKAAYKVAAGSIATTMNEYANIMETLNQAKQVQSLKDLPLKVLTIADPPKAGSMGNTDQNALNKFYNEWIEMQKELTKLSSNNELILVPKAGHYLHLDQPSYVIKAVREMVKSVVEDN